MQCLLAGGEKDSNGAAYPNDDMLASDCLDSNSDWSGGGWPFCWASSSFRRRADPMPRFCTSGGVKMVCSGIDRLGSRIFLVWLVGLAAEVTTVSVSMPIPSTASASACSTTSFKTSATLIMLDSNPAWRLASQTGTSAGVGAEQ